MPTQNPYVGPVSFQKKDEHLFFGREQEAADLVSLVAAYPATLLYATSGAGKTSLLNARLLPALAARGATVFGPVRVIGPGDALRGRNPTNIFSFYVLNGIAPRDVDAASTSLSDFLRPPSGAAADSSRPLRVLILDQFEELFTVFPEHWEHRRAFFEEIGDALENDPRLRVLFSMREELTARLDAYSGELPDGLRVRLRLERLDAEAALEAIKRPLEGTGVAYAPGIAEALVEELRRSGTVTAEFVEPLHLQIVCWRLWQKVCETGTNLIESAAAGGDVERALGHYYERCIQEIARINGVAEGVLRTEFERAFITPDGNRAAIRLHKGKTAGDLESKYIPELEKRYLIRQTFSGDDASWYELSHDRFIVPILASNKESRIQDPSYVFYARIESQALDWDASKASMKSKLLLSNDDLDVGLDWIADDKQTGYGPSRAARNLIAASDEARRKKRRAVAAGIAAFAVVAVLFWKMWTSGVRENERLQSSADAEARLSQSMLNEARIHDALSWAILSVSKGPGVEVPETAKQALADAVGAAMQGAWFPRRAESIRAVAFAPNGNRVLTLTPRELCVWMAIDRSVSHCVEPPDIGAAWDDANFSPGGTFVWAMSTADMATEAMTPFEFTLWRIPKMEKPFRHTLTAWALSDDDAYLALGERTLKLYRTRSGGVTQNAAITDLHALAFTHDGRFLVVAHDNRIDVLSVPQLRIVRSIRIGDIMVGDIEISQNDHHAALKVYPSSRIFLVDLRSGRILKPADIGPESRTIFVDGGRTLALVGPGSIRYLRTSDGKTVRETPVTGRGKSFVRTNGVIKGVKQKAERGTDTVLEIYMLGAKTTPKTKLLPTVVVDAVDLSPDGRRLVTSSGSLARVWDVDATAVPVDSFSLARLKQLGCDRLQQLGGATMPEVSRACRSR
jgi:WD40 repeat protein